MAYKITWSPRAEKRFDEIITYLLENWTEKEVRNFVLRTDEVLEMIVTYPSLYRKSEKKNIHEAILSKHNILIYKVVGKKIILLTFFDTRQMLEKKFK